MTIAKRNTDCFPGLEYRHCIAYSMFMIDFIDFLCNPDYMKKYNIKISEFDKMVYINSNETGIKLNRSKDRTRVGNYDSYNTHCYEYEINDDIFTIDGDLMKDFEYHDYSEEYFFQMTLIYKNCHVFYIILFNYLKKHMNTSFSVYCAPDPLDFIKISTELLDIAVQKGYHNDIIDLMSFVKWDIYKNHDEYNQRFSSLR